MYKMNLSSVETQMNLNFDFCATVILYFYSPNFKKTKYYY
jgi:hypothetical protein